MKEYLEELERTIKNSAAQIIIVQRGLFCVSYKNCYFYLRLRMTKITLKMWP
jgi:hypothetical protein